MNLSCSRTALLAAAQAVAPAVAPTANNPVLKNIKATAYDGTLALVAYDPTQGIGIRYELPGVGVTAPGECILPKEQLLAILQQNTDDTIRIAVRVAQNDAGADVTDIVVLSNGNDYVMPWMPPEEFPDFPEFDDEGRYHEVAAGSLRTLIERTAFAADKKEMSAKFALVGVLWEAAGGLVRLIGTDNKRLAVSEARCSHEALIDDPGVHIVQLKAIALLGRILEDDAELVRAALRDNDALFHTERATVYTALVQGKFPPHRDIIAKTRKEITQWITLPVAEFLARVRQAAIMTDTDSARIDVTFAPGLVTLTAREAVRGSSAVRMPLPGYDGATTQIAFDPQYLIEFLRALGDEPTEVLGLSTGERAALFRCGESTVYLCQPLTG